MNQSKTLVLFTTSFPFGNGEIFLGQEVSYLLSAFDKIIVITSNVADSQTRPLPDSVHVIRIPVSTSFKYKLLALLQIFNLETEKEIASIFRISNLKLTKRRLLDLFSYHAKGIELFSLLKKTLTTYDVNKEQLFLYSYWMNNAALGIALYKQKYPKVKTLCRAHGWDLYFERHETHYIPLRSFILKRIDACFCISKNGMQYLDNKTNHLFTEKLRLSRLGTHNTIVSLSGQNKEILRLVSCSVLIPLKRIHLIIEALSLINDFDVDWIHFGFGELDIELEKLARAKLLEKQNIRFKFAGEISNEKLLAFYSTMAVDLFINLSETEGLPVSIMEANSFGIPAIATNVGGVAEIIQDTKNGVLLNANCSPSEVSAAIEKFYGLSQKEKELMRNTAYEIWNKEFNAEVNYSAFVQSITTL